MAFLRIIASVLVILFAIKMAFRNLVLFTAIMPEYFQLSGPINSVAVASMLTLGFLFPLGLFVLTLLHAKRSNAITNRLFLILPALVFLVLQVMYVAASSVFLSNSMNEGISETIKSIWLFSIGAFIPFMALFLGPFSTYHTGNDRGQ